jgi:phosphatidylglycerophosphate synthase
VFDTRLRKLIDPALDQLAQRLAAMGISANGLTLAGVPLALGAALAIGHGQFGVALALIAANRLLDGLDGAVARINGPSDFGGYLDSLADYVFYLAIPLAFAAWAPVNELAAAILIASFTLTSVSFLAFAAIAAKRGISDAAHGPKSFVYSSGLAEGGETIFCFLIMCLLPDWFATIALVFAAICLLTVAQRIAMARQTLSK